MLVRPFIQTIRAFDATNGGVALLSILGGDAITTINYEIFSNGSSVYSSSMQVTDNGGTEIRNFEIPLLSTMGIVNNNSYTIRAYTQNATETSGYSSVQYFTCYVTPTVTLVDSDNITLTDSYEFHSGSGILTANFAKNDVNSPAELNQVSIDIYGMNDVVKDLVYSSGDVYTPFAINFNGLLPTGAEGLYTTYTIDLSWSTVQGMQVQSKIILLTCNYEINTSTGNISVENECENGRIKVRCVFSSATIWNSLGNASNTVDVMTVDSAKLYISVRSHYLYVYDKTTDTITSQAAPSGLFIIGMAMDDTNLYVGGLSGRFAIYNKGTSTFGSLITTPFGTSGINAVATDAYKVYIGGASGKFAVYDKTTGEFGSLITSPTESAIYFMALDNDNVYTGGNSGSFAVYNKANGTFGSSVSTPFESSDITTMAIDGNSVYVAGSDGKFAIYNKENGTFSGLIETPFGSSQITSITSDDKYLYIVSGDAGSSSGKFATYNKINGAFSELISTPSETAMISCITTDNDYLYIGNIHGDIFSVSIQQPIEIQRRETNDADSHYTALIKTEYDVFSKLMFYDYFCKNNTLYTYRYVSGNTIEDVEVLSSFDGAYIADGTTAFNITAEWDRDSFAQNHKSAIYAPYGRKYPVIAYNAVTNYRSGSDSCIVLAQSLYNNRQNNYIDRVAQTEQQKAVNKFLTNRRVKVIKDFNGDIALVCVIDVVGNSFVKELGNTLATTQFNWVEVGEFTDEDFRKLGITNSFKLIET